MQPPQSNTPIDRCRNLAAYTQAAVTRYVALFSPGPEVAAQLQAVADTLGRASGALGTAQDGYRAAVLALIGPRVEVKLVDLLADETVRSVKRAADEAGVSDMVFKNGVTPIVRPVGQTEVDELRALEGRIQAASAWAQRTAAGTRIQGVRTQYEAALGRRKEAMTAAGSARAVRDQAREDFLDVYASAAASIKGVFPRDRARQDVFFDVIRAADVADDEESTPAPVPAA